MDKVYRGRFAPSPTGPLHFGSLVAAAGSWMDARLHGGKWLVRIEDIDEVRTVPGADTLILRTLEAYGLEWDEEVVWQTQRHDLYAAALQSLGSRCFSCACSRKDVGEQYPGTCRDGLPEGKTGRVIRLRTSVEPVQFHDRRLGWFSEPLSDFVLQRADGLYAYQLVVVVDDAAQEITDVVRGADLLDSTPRQIFLQQQLQVPTPRYLHLPLALNTDGQKLSKQNHAPPVAPTGDAQLLAQALRFAGYDAELGATCREVLQATLSRLR